MHSYKYTQIHIYIPEHVWLERKGCPQEEACEGHGKEEEEEALAAVSLSLFSLSFLLLIRGKEMKDFGAEFEGVFLFQ